MIVSDYMQRSYIEMVNPSFWNSFQISIKRRIQYEIGIYKINVQKMR